MAEENRRVVFTNPNQIKCTTCGKTVYPLEKVSTREGDNFHKACFRCELCGGTLKIGYYIYVDKKYYCKQHQEVLKQTTESTTEETTDSEPLYENRKPYSMPLVSHSEPRSEVVQEPIGSISSLKEKFENKTEEKSESVLSPPPPRTLDELLAADQAQSQSPLPPPPPPPPEPFDEGEGFPFFLFNQPVFIRILQRRLDAEREMEEEEKRDYTTLSTMQIINEPELAPTYKVETLNSHFQLLNLLELDSENKALYYYGTQNGEAHVYKLDLTTGVSKKVEQITLQMMHCISSRYGFLAVCSGREVQVVHESTGQLVDGNWNEKSPGGQTNGVTIGLIREVSGDETIILLISRNGGELAIFNIVETGNNQFKGILRQFISVELNINYAALGTYALSKYLIAAPDYGKGPVVFEIEDNGLFHRKGIELQFPKKGTSSMHCSWQTQGTLLAAVTERGECVIWDFATKKLVKVLTHCKQMKALLELQKKNEEESKSNEQKPEEKQQETTTTTATTNLPVTESNNSHTNSDNMQTKITTTETDNVMETASETSEDSTDQFLSFNAVCIRLCKFNPFPLFNHILVYAESDRFVHIVDTRSWDHQIIQYSVDEQINGLCFSPDGRKLYVAHTHGISVYEFQFRNSLVEECLHFINKNRKLKDVYKWDFDKLPLDLQYKLNMNN